LHGRSALAVLLVAGAVIACGEGEQRSRDELRTSRAATSSGVAEIAYEYCFFDAYYTETWVCELTVTTSDASSSWSFGNGSAPAFSPNGSRVAFVRDTGISVLNLADGTIADLGPGSAPAWSPDGTKIAFANDPAGTGSDLYVMNSDGTNVARITTNAGFRGDPDWSPAGERIAFDCEVASGNRDICAIATDGSGLTRLTTDPAFDHGARWSPDGDRIALVTNRFGAQDIGVMAGQGGEAAG
jgi:Tol biopolymer transport system component